MYTDHNSSVFFYWPRPVYVQVQTIFSHWFLSIVKLYVYTEITVLSGIKESCMLEEMTQYESHHSQTHSSQIIHVWSQLVSNSLRKLMREGLS